ncbi:MAG: hypothetical protein IIU10_03290 [Paludibacteraceae bacterium]|nr:hypothetical protein [Paludibacteraceae bacterium]
MNFVLGALSLTLAGCHSSKQVVQENSPLPMLKYGVPAQVIAMYGVPVDYNPMDFQVPSDTVAAPDTVQADKPERPEMILTKYGIPGVFN